MSSAFEPASLETSPLLREAASGAGEPPELKRRVLKRLVQLVLLGLVLVLVALLSALTAMRFAIHGREVEVPALTGRSPSEAESTLISQGLVLEVEDRFYSQNVREGEIISQLPLAGTRVRRGWRVRVALSLGPQRVPVPNVVGESDRAAEINIQKRGLEVGAVAHAHLPGMPAGQVVAQDPAGDAGGMTSPKVNLLVTPAPDEKILVMPDFTGQRLAEATAAVEAAGLHVGRVTLLTPLVADSGNATGTAATGSAAAMGAGSAASGTAGNASAAANGGAPAGAAALNTAPAKTAPASGKAIIARQSPSAGQKVSTGAVVSFDVTP
jgi:beta-lactam-binding protein with PASTA domain